MENVQESKQISRHICMDIMTEVLSWLPARSLVRFRCVSKLWHSITHQPNFIDAQLNRARKVFHPSILLFFSSNSWDRYGITVIDQHTKAPRRVLWGPKFIQEKVSMQESCNGLICVFSNDSIRVINPVTGESRIPPKPTRIPSVFASTVYLGFHPEKKEYKLIRFYNCYYSGGCEVYTMGSSTNSWRKIYNPDSHFPLFPSATLKGALYWVLPQLPYPLENQSVVSFDLGDEKFTRISLPSFEICQGRRYQPITSLLELQGNLVLPTLVEDTVNAGQVMDIWMMKINTDEPNNTKHEWARKYSISLPLDSLTTCPLLIHEEKLLMHRNARNLDGSICENVPALTFTYHSSNGDCEQVLYTEGKPATPLIYHYLQGLPKSNEAFFHDYGIRCSLPSVHVESLVSPPGGSSEDIYSDSKGDGATQKIISDDHLKALEEETAAAKALHLTFLDDQVNLWTQSAVTQWITQLR